MTATLYSMSVSHPSVAVRAMLRHKGIPSRIVQIVPGMQPLVVRGLGFPGHTVPALEIDGRRLVGSRQIARTLDVLYPDPRLFPHEPEARRAVEEAERWGDEVLQPVPRRIFRRMLAENLEARRWLAKEAHVPGGALLARPALQAKLFARMIGADEAAVRADIAALPEHLGEVERLREAGVIGGVERNAADFQIAASVRCLAGFADLAPLLGDHPAVAWAETVVPPFPGPVPALLNR